MYMRCVMQNCRSQFADLISRFDYYLKILTSFPQFNHKSIHYREFEVNYIYTFQSEHLRMAMCI